MTNDHRCTAFVADFVRRLRGFAIAAQGTGVLAILRMILAGEKWPEESAARHEPAPTVRTPFRLDCRQVVGFADQRLDVGTLHRLGERSVEILEHFPPVHVAVLDLVEVALHVRGESDVEYVWEALDHHLLDLLAQLSREEAALLEYGVSSIDQRRNDRRIRRGTADAESLELLDEAGLGVPRRRLGEVLRGRDGFNGNLFTLLNHWESLLFFERFALAGFAHFFVQTLVSVELDDAASRSEKEAIEIEVDGGRVEDRRHHLRGHEALPDQFVQPILIVFEVLANELRTAGRIGRPYRLVRVLRILRFTIGVQTWTIGQILLPVHHPDVVASLSRGGGGDTGGIGAHVGDQPDATLFSELDSLVQVLRESHRTLGTEAEFFRGILLESAGRKRRSRILSSLTTLDFGNLKRLPRLERSENRVRFTLVADYRLLAIEQV